MCWGSHSSFAGRSWAVTEAILLRLGAAITCRYPGERDSRGRSHHRVAAPLYCGNPRTQLRRNTQQRDAHVYTSTITTQALLLTPSPGPARDFFSLAGTGPHGMWGVLCSCSGASPRACFRRRRPCSVHLRPTRHHRTCGKIPEGSRRFRGPGPGSGVTAPLPHWDDSVACIPDA